MARSHEGHSEREEGRQGQTGGPHSNLQDRSLDELRQMAGELNIEGRNRLDRDQLIEEIQRERGTGQSKGGPSTQSGGAGQSKGGSSTQSRGTGYEAGGKGQGGTRERQEPETGRQEGSRQEGERKGGSQRKRQ